MRRLRQDDWETPQCADWMATLDEAVECAGSEIVLVAHSLSCALVAHWAVVASRHRVHGALLVAPADPLSIPAGPQGFAPMPMQRFGFPSIVVASTTDPFVTVEGAAAFAAAWGSTFVNIGDAGHINTGSGFGEWPGRTGALATTAAAVSAYCLSQSVHKREIRIVEGFRI